MCELELATCHLRAPRSHTEPHDILSSSSNNSSNNNGEGRISPAAAVHL